MPDDFRKHRHRVRLHDELVVVGAVTLRHHARVGQLVVAVLLEADGECLHRLGGGFGHQRNDGAGIHAAAQERADRHVSHHAKTHRFAQLREQRLAELGFRQRELRPVVETPVALRDGAALRDLEIVSGRHASKAAEPRPGRGNVAIRHVLVDRGEVGLGRNGGIGEQGLRLRAEDDHLVVQVIVERLLPGAVARQHERAPSTVPQRNREHPPQLGETRGSHQVVEGEDDLGVRARFEGDTVGGEPRAELGEVVDLAVERDPIPRAARRGVGRWEMEDGSWELGAGR